MARPLRRDLEGGWYHVTARGEHRGTIFGDRRDHEHFLELLEAMRERFRVQVLAFVLMGNHYHLMVCTPDANLSRAIQWLNISYGVWFNKRYQSCGHVFQGRFKAIVVEQQGWGLLLSQYVHLNPVRIKLLGLGKRERAVEKRGPGTVPTPQQIEQRLTTLRTYRWSSYRAYAGYEAPPAWLSVESILTRAGGQKAYRRGVEERVRQGVAESPWQNVKWGLVLGSAAFSQRVRDGLAAGREMGAKGRCARAGLLKTWWRLWNGNPAKRGSRSATAMAIGGAIWCCGWPAAAPA
jgi:putative transposase